MDGSGHECEQSLNTAASSTMKVNNAAPGGSNAVAFNQSSPPNGSSNQAKPEGSALMDDKELFPKDEDKGN